MDIYVLSILKHCFDSFVVQRFNLLYDLVQCLDLIIDFVVGINPLGRQAPLTELYKTLAVVVVELAGGVDLLFMEQKWLFGVVINQQEWRIACLHIVCQGILAELFELRSDIIC